MADNPDSWSPGVIASMLRRQIAELEAVRGRLFRRGENPDDNDELRNAILEIQSFREILSGIEDELKGGKQ